MRMVSVACFGPQGVEFHSFRLTKRGRVNMRDVNRQLKNTPLRVPYRYTENGIRKRNPDVGWPDWCVMDGHPPEASGIGHLVHDLREAVLRHHPSKMTQTEKAWVGDLEVRLQRGSASEEDLIAYIAFKAEIEARPINIDEW